jgi:predicted signal transduction protein with EAL and GGDEF domain
VLRSVGKRLLEVLRKSDTVARLDGDEFAVLLPDATLDESYEIVAKIQAVLERPVNISGQLLDIGSSTGIATYPEHGADGGEMLRHADIAMHAAKRSHKGVAVFDPNSPLPRRGQLTLLGELRKAVERDELMLYFQPKVNLRTGKTSHCEALVRWIHPERGFVPPLEFIPFAEQTGYIRTITCWVIKAAIRQCSDWQSRGLDMCISVNISARDLLDPDLPGLVADSLKQHGVAADRICLEITESGFMEDTTQALQVLTQFAALGVCLSIDDYGTGYSSLSYIRKLPIQELKIDQSFVKNMVKDRDDATIVRSTIELGHNMGLKVVAEGVEDQFVWDLLRELGCDHAQGYFMSRPLPPKDLETWLAADDHAWRLIASISKDRPVV